MAFDHAQSPRLGQRLPVEAPGVQLVTLETLPEVAHRGQIVFAFDINEFRVFDGVAWQIPSAEVGGSSTQMFVGEDPPAADAVGDLWMNTNNYLIYIWDGDSWKPTEVLRADVDLAANHLWTVVRARGETEDFTVYYYFEDPSLTAVVSDGDWWVNTTNNLLYIREPGNWVADDDPDHIKWANAAGVPAAIADFKIDVYFSETPPAEALDAFDINDLWVKDNYPKRWDGRDWQTFRDMSIDDSKDAADQAAADAEAAAVAAQEAQNAANAALEAATSDGEIPSSSPDVVLMPLGLGSLRASWEPVVNRDGLTYDVHLSLSPIPNLPLNATLVGSTGATAFSMNALPNGMALVKDTTYYCRVIARDVDGFALSAGLEDTAQIMGGDVLDRLGTVEQTVFDQQAELDNILPITEVDIADGAVSTQKLVDGAISSIKLAVDAVTNEKVAPNAITAAEIQNNAVTAVKILDGVINSGKLADGAVTSAKIVDDAVTTAKIVNDAINNAKIAPDAVTSTEIAPNAVTTAKIVDDAINAAKIAALAVGSGELADSAVTGIKINTGAVTETKISDDAITTPKIAAGAVTADEIAANAITAVKILAGEIDTEHLAAEAVTAANILANTITSGQIAADAITTSELAAGAVTAVKIVSGAIETDKLAANAVTAGKIAANTITAQEIAADAITADELAANAVTANKILAGAVETDKLAANAVTAAKILANTITANEIAASAIGADEIAANAVVAGKVAADAIDAAQIKANAITTIKLAADAVTADKILAGAIGVDELAANSVIAAKIATDAIEATKIKSGAVETDKLAANAVTAQKIAADAVTAGKIAAKSISSRELIISDFTNFLLGADFESDIEVPFDLAGAENPGRFQTSTNYAVTGTKSLRVLASPSSGYLGLKSDVPVVVGESYRLRFSARISTDYNGTNSTNEILADEGAEDLISVPLGVSAFNGPDLWQDFSVVIPITFGGGLEIALNVGHTTGDLYIDNIALQKMESGALIVDGSITADKISSDFVYAGQVSADQITTGVMSADVTVSGKFKTSSTGQRVEMDGSGLKQFGPLNEVLIDLPTDPSKSAKFSGNVDALSLTVQSGFDLRGTNNQFSVGSETKLRSALVASESPPLATPSYNTWAPVLSSSVMGWPVGMSSARYSFAPENPTYAKTGGFYYSYLASPNVNFPARGGWFKGDTVNGPNFFYHPISTTMATRVSKWTNLLYNPSFEAGTGGGSPPDWIAAPKAGAGTGAVTATAENLGVSLSYRGSYVCKLLPSLAVTGFTLTTVHKYHVTPGQQYSCRGAAKAISTSVSGLRMGINWYAADQTTLISTVREPALETANSSAWTPFFFDGVNAPANAFYATVFVEGNIPQTGVYLDGILFEKASAAAPYFDGDWFATGQAKWRGWSYGSGSALYDNATPADRLVSLCHYYNSSMVSERLELQVHDMTNMTSAIPPVLEERHIVRLTSDPGTSQSSFRIGPVYDPADADYGDRIVLGRVFDYGGGDRGCEIRFYSLDENSALQRWYPTIWLDLVDDGVTLPITEFTGVVAGTGSKLKLGNNNQDMHVVLFSKTHAYVFKIDLDINYSVRLPEWEWDLTGSPDFIGYCEDRAAKTFDTYLSFPGKKDAVSTPTEYTNNTWEDFTVSTNWWASFTWFKSSGSYETTMSALGNVTMKKRAKLNVSMPNIPSAADGVKVYLGRQSTTPTRTQMWLQATQPALGTTSITYENFSFSGTNPPAASSFPSGTPAKIIADTNNNQSGLPKVEISGTGLIRGEQFQAFGDPTTHALVALVRCATTANITTSGLQTIDGVALAAGDRVLVKDQTVVSGNGVFIAATGPWTRAPDAATGPRASAQLIKVGAGSANAGTTWSGWIGTGSTPGTNNQQFYPMMGNTVRLYWTGSAYPYRPAGLTVRVEWVGPSQPPVSTYQAQSGDTWINTNV